MGLFNMEPKKIILVSQLISAMGDVAEKLENSYNEKNLESFKKAREEILSIQNKLSDSLKRK